MKCLASNSGSKMGGGRLEFRWAGIGPGVEGLAHGGFKVNTLASREDTVSAKGDRSCSSFRMVLPQSSGDTLVTNQEA